MTLEKPPWGKAVKSRFIMEILRKNLQQRLHVSYSQLISSWATSFSLKYEIALP
jgi:hypothetical protein